MRKIITTFALLVATSLSASAAPLFEDTFSPQQPGWSFQSPSSGFLGELNNNVNVASVTLTVTAPSDDPNATLEFDLLGFRSLDGVNCCTDTLTLTINGTIALIGAFSHNPAINRILSNPSGATYTLLFVNIPGVGGANSGHRFIVPHHVLKGINTYTWSYSPLQSFVDEAWGLDNVKVITECGDDRDTIIQEYKTFKVIDRITNKLFTPTCDDFTQTAHSVFFTFAELTVGADFDWALLRSPLLAPESSGHGLDKWRMEFGASRIINSAYRNPAHNFATPGASTKSRHMFGDAADLRNQTGKRKEWNQMIQAALRAGADWIEPVNGPCGLACAHADWRNTPGSYLP